MDRSWQGTAPRLNPRERPLPPGPKDCPKLQRFLRSCKEIDHGVSGEAKGTLGNALWKPRPPASEDGNRLRVRGLLLLPGQPARMLEDEIAAVDDERVAHVIAGGGAREIDGDTAEVAAHAPAAHGHARQHLVREGLAVEMAR